jgi:KDO2-lipid IV(A) lauroyltransferase
MYYLLLFILYPISLLPLWVLYGISGAARRILFGLFGYRRAIVRANLKHAFPKKSESETEQIRRDFERAFCDQWIETIKLLTLSKERLARRMVFTGENLLALEAQGKNCAVFLGHQFNWEWASLRTQWATNQDFAGIYLPLSSKPVDALMQQLRSRGGGILISMKNLRAGLAKLAGRQYTLGLIADQNPSQPDAALWLPFMHREAPFHTGAETLARRAGAVPLFAALRCTRRGHYEVQFETLWNEDRVPPAGELTRRYVQRLEAALEAQPHNYLWSHRRWKHVRKEESK